MDEAPADLESRTQILGVEGLGDEIVDVGVQAGHDVVALIARGDEDDVRGLFTAALANSPADDGTVEARHDPIEDDESWRVAAFEALPGIQSVCDLDGVVAARFDGVPHEEA